VAKRFTLIEAERLLPEIEVLIREALSLKGDYQTVDQELQAFLQRVAMQGGMVVDRSIILDGRVRRDQTGERLREVVEKIQEHGCVLKDLDVGLVDFPTLFQGREVYLCWKLGEPGIHYWHGVEEGFAGRKQIDREFLDHHEGDLAN